MFVKFSCFWQHFSSYERFSANQHLLGHMKPRRTNWSGSRRDPCTLERVTGAQTFFPVRVDKVISLVSIREASFCTYVPQKRRHLYCPSCTRSTYRHVLWVRTQHTTQTTDDPFYDRGSTFPLFVPERRFFFTPNRRNVNLDFEKQRFVDLGHGIICRDAF